MASPGGSEGAPPADLQPSTSPPSSSRLQNATRLTYKVLQDSTNDFSEERRIGKGAYGEVYLGTLENGEEVAVKRLYNKFFETNDQQFTHEFENLMRLDHPNIVQLVGYCYETQHIPMQYMGKTIFAEQTCRALCFEYMQKRSLEKHLSDEHGGLDWRTRYKIIKETCEGLKHLHEGGLYHLDLKPDNILLDVNMVAKLADFGLSKIFGDEENKDPELVIGTLGYLPPEYIDEKLVSKKLDIFSLGVVMTKIIAGPEGHTRCAEMSNQKFLCQVNENWRNRLKARWNSPGSLQAYCKQVNECTKIAMKCMDKDRNVRPSIVDIINKLNKTEHSIATKLWPYAPVDADAGGKRKTEHNQPPPVSSTSALVRPDAPPPLHSPTSSAVRSSATPIPLAPSRTTLQHKLFYSQSPLGLLKITERVYVFASCLMADVLYDDKHRQNIRDIVLQVRSDYNNAHVKVFNFQEGQGESLLSHVLSSYEITVMEYPMQYEGCPLLTMEMIHRFLRSGEIWLSMEQHNVLIMHCERGGLAVLAFMLAGLLLYQKQCTGEQTTLEMVYANAPRWLIRPLSPLNHMPSQIRYLQYISQRNVRYKWPPGERQLTLDCVILRSIPDFNDEVGCTPIFRIHGQEALLGLNDPPKVLFSTPKEYVRLYKQANDDLIKADIRCHLRGDVVLECINMDLGQERDVTMFRIMFNTAFIRSRILTLDRDQIDTMWYSRDRFPRDFRAEIFFSEMSTANQLDPMDSRIQEKTDLQLPVKDSEGDEALVQQPANSPEIIELRPGIVSPPPPASTSSTVRPEAPPPPPVPDQAPSPAEDAENIRKAVQGWGTDEKALIEILGHRTAAQRTEIAVAYEGLYDEPLVDRLRSELSGDFRDAMMLWTMDPAARDAKLAYKALRKKGGDRQAWVLIEVACASSPDHLVAVRKAYCSAYNSSLEEDVAACPLYKEPLNQFLVRLVSSYRYAGEHVNGELARAEAAELHAAVVAGKQPLHGDVIRIVSSRSKRQLKATLEHYKQEHGKAIDEILQGNRNDQLSAMLKTAVWCLTSPEKHFAEVIRSSIEGLGTDEGSLTRAITSRAEIDMKKVKEEYRARYKTTVTDDVVGDTSGDYKDMLLTLVGPE